MGREIVVSPRNIPFCVRLATLAIALTLGGCSGSKSPGGQARSCRTTSDCEAGWVCDLAASECMRLCVIDTACPADQACVKGACTPVANAVCHAASDCSPASACDDPSAASCVAGRCHFGSKPVGTACAKLCVEGTATCNAAGECLGVAKACTTPPVTTCEDANSTCVTHAQIGACSEESGECSYAATRTATTAGNCVQECIDACDGITCAATNGGCQSNGHCVPIPAPAHCAYDLAADATPCFSDAYPTTKDGSCSAGVCDRCVFGTAADESRSCCSTGTQARSCLTSGTWGAWGTCSDLGACLPDTPQSQACCVTGTQTRTCAADCTWGSYGVCSAGGCAVSDTRVVNYGCSIDTQTWDNEVCGAACTWGAATPATGSLSCGAYVCSGTACLTSCNANPQCTGANVCRGGVCTSRGAVGDACDDADGDVDCAQTPATMTCVSSVCKRKTGQVCTADADGSKCQEGYCECSSNNCATRNCASLHCVACDPLNTATFTSCAAVKPNEDWNNYCAGTCNEIGGCHYQTGDDCTLNTTNCEGTQGCYYSSASVKRCAAPAVTCINCTGVATAGTSCVNVPWNEDWNAYCSIGAGYGANCNGSGACTRSNLYSCATDDDCASRHCCTSATACGTHYNTCQDGLDGAFCDSDGGCESPRTCWWKCNGSSECSPSPSSFCSACNSTYAPPTDCLLHQCWSGTGPVTCYGT